MQPTLQMMLEFCLDTDSDIGFPLQSFKSVPIVVSTRSIWFNGACGMYLKPYSVLDQLSLINWRPWTIKINSLFTHGTRLRYWQELTTIEDTRLSTLRKDCLTHSTAPQIDPERWCKFLVFHKFRVTGAGSIDDYKIPEPSFRHHECLTHGWNPTRRSTYGILSKDERNGKNRLSTRNLNIAKLFLLK